MSLECNISLHTCRSVYPRFRAVYERLHFQDGASCQRRQREPCTARRTHYRDVYRGISVYTQCRYVTTTKKKHLTPFFSLGASAAMQEQIEVHEGSGALREEHERGIISGGKNKISSRPIYFYAWSSGTSLFLLPLCLPREGNVTDSATLTPVPPLKVTGSPADGSAQTVHAYSKEGKKKYFK